MSVVKVRFDGVEHGIVGDVAMSASMSSASNRRRWLCSEKRERASPRLREPRANEMVDESASERGKTLQRPRRSAVACRQRRRARRREPTSAAERAKPHCGCESRPWRQYARVGARRSSVAWMPCRALCQSAASSAAATEPTSNASFGAPCVARWRTRYLPAPGASASSCGTSAPRSDPRRTARRRASRCPCPRIDP